jgi:UDP-N-acetylglucosamine diphosphorylase / glucose-1-phosphate thymidylyltransferase / UDP-N-acetylgalactosamine diphosphorylase / glucosamine-1-phosphate N-acetyltransferase / galactosamine-1-phosphate N-acetyltransferase
MLEPARFFDLTDERSQALFEGVGHAWELLPRLPDILADWLGDQQIIEGRIMDGALLGNAPVYVARGARIEPGAYVEGPAYIGPDVVIRHGAYIRANCVLLRGAMLGHASELKGSVLLPGAKAPHFAYVGDSILGNAVNIGAGTKLSNATMLHSPSVRITVDGVTFDTGLRKLGAIVGDHTQLGCNVVTNPGTLLGPRVVAYAGAVLRGSYPADTILKLHQGVEVCSRD